MPALRFRADGKHLENGAFRKQKRHDYHVISLTGFSLHKSKMTGDCCVFKFPPPPPRRSVDGKHLMRFQSETSVLKFLLRCVDGAFGY